MQFYSKLDYIKLMRQKRGDQFTLGWLEMAYALPAVGEEAEAEIIRNDTELLLTLPDYVS